MKLLQQSLHLTRQFLLAACTATLIVGCAADRLHDEGIEMVSQGQVEEGLDKLTEAAKSDPENLTFRKDLIQKKELIVQQLLVDAHNQRVTGHPKEAADIFRRIQKIEPNNPRAKAGLDAIAMDERHATMMASATDYFSKKDYEPALSLARAILLENPHHAAAVQLKRQIDEIQAKEDMAGPMLKSEYNKPVTLQFRDANLKMVVEALSRSNNINILLDKDVKADLRTTIFVKDASFEDTLDLILMQNQLEKKVLSDNTIFIYPNTAAKLKEYQDLKIRTFQLTNADAKQMQTMLKTLLKTKDTFIDEKNNTLVMRDSPDAIRLAEKLIAAQDIAEPEVMLEVAVMEINRSTLSKLGLRLPQALDFSITGKAATTNTVIDNTLNLPVVQNIPAQPLTLANLSDLGQGDVNIGTLAGGVDIRSEAGNANILASPRIRVRNKEKAKIMIGDRVPVITAAQTPVAGGSAVSTTNVQYLDVGLKLDVEPNIHLNDDVAIKLNLEVSNIVNTITTGQTVAYQIGARSTNTVLRLKDGETQVLAGLISDEDRKSVQKFPGLGDLPIIGRLFSSHADDKKKTEIILSITPHLTRAPTRPDAQNMEFWSGTDNTLRSHPLNLKSNSAPAVKKPSAAVEPSKPVAPATDAVKSEPIPVTGSPLSLNWLAPTQAKVGKEFEITLAADASEAVGTLSFGLDFDPTVLTIVKVKEGELFKSDGKKTIFTHKVDQKNGHVFAQVSRIGKIGIKGKGNVATFTFGVHGTKQQSPIMISSPLPVSASGVSMHYVLPSPWVMSLVEDAQ